MRSHRIVFAGTPEFACASLSALVEADLVPVAVYTQPDRPAGRGRRVTASPVKQYAMQRGIPVMQPQTLRDESAAAELGALRPDLLIVAAYGLILPQDVLDVPSHGCLNVHASLLPRWRGAAPIQAAILSGDVMTGISLMGMTAGLDCGPVFVGREVTIGVDETAGELHDRLAELGGRCLVENLGKILDGEIQAIEQDDALATYAGKIRKEDARLDWTLPAADLQRRIRAYNPVPGAFFFAQNDEDGARIKVWQATLDEAVNARPGTVVQYDADGVVIACGRGGLRLDALQLPGRKRVPAHEFVTQTDIQ